MIGGLASERNRRRSVAGRRELPWSLHQTASVPVGSAERMNLGKELGSQGSHRQLHIHRTRLVEHHLIGPGAVRHPYLNCVGVAARVRPAEVSERNIDPRSHRIHRLGRRHNRRASADTFSRPITAENVPDGANLPGG